MACLILVPLTALPLARLFLMLGRDPEIGLIGVQSDVFYVACTLAALPSAWIAWKRPLLTFPTNQGKPTLNWLR